MWRMDKIRRCGWVLLVKHEVDCWILWNYGIPALGIPDSIDWSGEWRAHLEGLEVWCGTRILWPNHQFSAALPLTLNAHEVALPAIAISLTAHLQGAESLCHNQRSQGSRLPHL